MSGVLLRACRRGPWRAVAAYRCAILSTTPRARQYATAAHGASEAPQVKKAEGGSFLSRHGGKLVLAGITGLVLYFYRSFQVGSCCLHFLQQRDPSNGFSS
jgi:hypothetical protein